MIPSIQLFVSLIGIIRSPFPKYKINFNQLNQTSSVSNLCFLKSSFTQPANCCLSLSNGIFFIVFKKSLYNLSDF